MTQTTIKVSTEVRNRVQRHARRCHVSQAAILERALNLLDREAFFDQLRVDVADSPETDNDRAEREAWLSGPLMVNDAGVDE